MLCCDLFYLSALRYIPLLKSQIMLGVKQKKVLRTSSHKWLCLFFHSSNAVSNACKDNVPMNLTIIKEIHGVSVFLRYYCKTQENILMWGHVLQFPLCITAPNWKLCHISYWKSIKQCICSLKINYVVLTNHHTRSYFICGRFYQLCHKLKALRGVKLDFLSFYWDVYCIISSCQYLAWTWRKEIYL